MNAAQFFLVDSQQSVSINFPGALAKCESETMLMNRRDILLGAGSAAMASHFTEAAAQAPSPLLTVSSRTIEVRRHAAKVFGVINAGGGHGIIGFEGDSFAGDLHNLTSNPLVMHWHGQVHAAANQDRARPNGGMLAVGAADRHDYLLTSGTHWMHSHQLTEQQLLAAPMIAREKNNDDLQEIVVMLHDFAFRPPAEILSELGGSSAHGAHGARTSADSPTPNQTMSDHGPGMSPGVGHGHMTMSGADNMSAMAPHANDVAYDAYLANDRTLDDPDVIRVDKGGRVRLRIINGATATAFFIDTGLVVAEVVAVDGSPCEPFRGRRFPLAQGQRIDLLLSIPSEGGAFPVLAQVEADSRRTGIVLATRGASVTKVADTAPERAAFATLSFDEKIRAKNPLAGRPADRTYRLMFGEEAGYRWLINGKIYGEHAPLDAKLGERVEIIFMNPTSMMHPMHLHGHHFQVVGSRAGRFSGPVRDTVIVPPHTPVLIAFDADKRGDWYLHCHHLYHMATGMMTELRVS